jgi:arabinofuranosyltransferase
MLAVLAGVAAHRLVTTRAPVRTWIAAIAPAVVLVGGWFAWKVATYGDILPNTYYAKSGSNIAHGAAYVWMFAGAYVLWPFLVGIAAVAIVRRRAAKLPLALVAVQVAYVIAVGGDFMEFRFVVPLLPPLAVALGELLTTPTRIKPALQIAAAIAFLAAFSLRHLATFDGAADASIDSVDRMATYYGTVYRNDWSLLGDSLRAALAPLRPTIACDGAGAIPFFSDLPTIDQLGLNDAWVARHGARPPAAYTRPGHQRFATYDYLRERRATFVIGQPIVIERGDLAEHRKAKLVHEWLTTVLGAAPLPGGAFDIVAAPVDDGYEVLMWYLTPDPEISARIAGWDRITLQLGP